MLLARRPLFIARTPDAMASPSCRFMSEPSPPPIEGLRVEVSPRREMTGMQQSSAVF